jgi:hypothetical protein
METLKVRFLYRERYEAKEILYANERRPTEGGRKEHRKYNGQEVTAGAEDGMMTNLPAIMRYIKPLTPNDPYRGRTAPLTSNVAFYIFLQQI